MEVDNLTRPLPRRRRIPPPHLHARSELTVVGRFYEVHKYLGSRWELAIVCDDKESAIAEAKSIIDSSKIAVGVRVLRVIAQENKQKDVTFLEQTIFRQSPVDEHNAEASARLMRAWQEVEAAREKRRLDRIHDRMRYDDEYDDEEDGAPFDRMRLILQLTILAWVVVMIMFVVHQRFI